MTEAEYREIQRTLKKLFGDEHELVPIELPSDHALRGTPLVGGRRSSAITGSSPERALLAKERRGRLHVQQPDPLPRPTPEVRPAARERSKLGRRVSAPGGRFF